MTPRARYDLSMRESDLLHHISRRSADLSAEFPQVLVGPGDDCAVVHTPSGDHFLLTTDQLVEGRHFTAPSAHGWRKDGEYPLCCTREGYLDLIARKAVARSVSDIAAMGGTPFSALATACLPPGFPQDAADHLFDGMHKWASHWKCPLVGGDIASFAKEMPGPMVLTTTVVGLPHAKRGPVLRSSAKADDDVYVTGVLGGSFASNHHMIFEPRLEEARALLDAGAKSGGLVIGSMMDLSDGLGRDAARIGRASVRVLELDAARLPMREGVGDWRQAAGEGEDYELLFTAWTPSNDPRPFEVCGTRVTSIGRVLGRDDGAGPEYENVRHVFRTGGAIIRTPEGTWTDAEGLGWEHD